MKNACFLLISLAFLTQCQPKPTPQYFSEKMPDWTLTPFLKADSVNPVLLPSPTATFDCPILKKAIRWEEKDVFNPAAVVRDGRVWLLYRAENQALSDVPKTSRLGLAVSDDGFHFKKQGAPVLFPDNDAMKKYEFPGGIEDPRLVETADGRYILTYTAYDGTTARLCVASSKDLQHWTKHGLVLTDRFENTWSKSGAIVVRQVGEKMIAERVGGKFWLYFGDTDLFAATSDDLIHWQPVLDANGKLLSVLQPRKGFHDSRLVESGPFALLTKRGILLIYNGMNAEKNGDPTLLADTYSAGQALFDRQNPTKLLARTQTNFFKPTQAYERVGQVHEVCFLEGLVWFRNRWLLYYGTADSKIAAATCVKFIHN